MVNYGATNSVNARVVAGKPDASANYLRTLSSTQHPTMQYNPTASSQISLNSRPLQRSTLNSSTRINFIFNGSAVSSIPISTPVPTLVPALALPEKENIPIVYSPSIP